MMVMQSIETEAREYELEVLATGVSFEQFLEQYVGQRCEWVDGEVHKMASIELKHWFLSLYLKRLFETYFDFNPIATLLGDPFVMHLPEIRRGRAPDLSILMNDSASALLHNQLQGAADICIEIVSPGSIRTDHGDKFYEYEKGGVPEYWILDFIHTEARFYRLNEEGLYTRIIEDADGYYVTPQLPKFKLHVPTLWSEKYPGPREVLKMIEAWWEAE
jgi:Uma2 family endonuclease